MSQRVSRTVKRGSNIENRELRNIEIRELRTESRESRIGDRGSRIENRESRSGKRGSRIVDRGSRIENREWGIENRESGIEKRGSRIENREWGLSSRVGRIDENGRRTGSEQSGVQILLVASKRFCTFPSKIKCNKLQSIAKRNSQPCCPVFKASKFREFAIVCSLMKENDWKLLWTH